MKSILIWFEKKYNRKIETRYIARKVTMEFPISKRMASFTESVFTELAQIKNSKLSDGLSVIDLSIGSLICPLPLLLWRNWQEVPVIKNYTGTR